MLTAAATSEVFTCDDDISGFELGDKFGIGIFHHMLSEFMRIGSVQIACGDNQIGIDIVTELPDIACNDIH
ncbi:hypothetical protein D1872_319550 [compost metagenome]